jgi:very-short-patch-repair endonuclease
MLIPQPRIGIAERRRPDFVVFVPLQCWNYKWIAIELDGAHGSEQEARDAERDIELSANGYEVFSVRPAERGYFEEVRRFVERVEEWMGIAREDTWRVAIEAKVIEHELPELPF